MYDLEHDGVTQSMIASILSCPMRAHYRYAQQVVPKELQGADALYMGSFVHAVLEHYYRGDVPIFASDPEARMSACVDLVYEEERERLDPAIVAPTAYETLTSRTGIVRTLLTSMVRFYPEDLVDLNWVDLERMFAVDYIHPEVGLIKLRGKFDGVLEDESGNLWLVETKTKRAVNDVEIADTLAFNIQVRLYMFAMSQVYGKTIGGVIYNLIRRPSIRQTKKETLHEFLARLETEIVADPTQYFSRYPVKYSVQEQAEWVNTDLRQIMDLVVAWSKEDRPLRNSGNCMQWSRWCDYLRTCTSGDRSYLKQQIPHIELVEQ